MLIVCKKAIIGLCCLCLSIMPFYAAQAADVVAAGTTATGVTEDAGRYRVDIAPVMPGGTSYNQYNRFNVIDHVSLDNRSVAANTIINEVVAPNPSIFSGTLEVLGDRAHVINVNPWGISVNGGNFVNTAGLILSTAGMKNGEFKSGVSFIPNNTGGFDTQLLTSQGSIVIEEGGLAGAFNNLELIAKKITVNGAIANENTNEQTRTRLIAGHSTAVVDASIPTDAPSDKWVRYGYGAKKADEEIYVDITGIGSITDARIAVVVTDEGAGVRSAGNMIAAGGELLITAQGIVSQNGGRLASQTGMTIAARDSIILANTNVQSEGLIALGSFDESILITSDSEKTIVKGQDIFLSTLNGGVTNIGATVESATDIEIEAKGDIITRTVDSKRRAIFDAAFDINATTSQGNITNVAGRWVASDSMILSAKNGVFSDLLEREDVPNAGEVRAGSKSSGFWIFKRKSETLEVNYGDLLLPGEQAVAIANNDVTIHAQDITIVGGELYSNNGNIILTAGTEEKPGKVYIEALATGSASFKSRCLLLCDQNGHSNVAVTGGFVSAGQDVTITAAEVHNKGAEVLAVNDLTISGHGDNQAEIVTAESIEMVLYAERQRGFMSGNAGVLQRIDQGGAFVANQGRLRIDSLRPVEITGGFLSAGTETQIENGVLTIRERQIRQQGMGDHIGLLSGAL